MNFIASEYKETVKDMSHDMKLLKKHSLIVKYLFSHTGIAVAAIISGVLITFGAVLLANQALLAAVLSSSQLALGSKLVFIINMAQISITNMGGLQLWLFMLSLPLLIYLLALWLAGLFHQHNKQWSHNYRKPLVSGLVSIFITFLGLYLISPVVTRAGISIEVASHFSGTLLLVTGLVLLLSLSNTFVRLLFRTALGSREY